MSDDQWNNPNQPPNPNQPGGEQQNGWNVESDLPKPGESWDNAHTPRPIHEVNEDDWGTAPFDGSVQTPAAQQPQQGFGQAPGPAQQAPYQGAPHQGPPNQGPPNQGAYPPQPQGPGGYPPQQMTYQPNTAMSTNQLDNNDIIAIVVSIFFPGAGHIMLGQTTKGIVIIAAMILTCGLAAIAWPVVIIDAVMVAQARKKRPVGEWEFFPK